MMSQIQLYSAILCPFAHRVRLTLLEKGVPFESIEIDPQNKPANFLEISPYGKVPVLKHGDNCVWESAIVNEYLEETFPAPPLLPLDPIQRAQARIWINFADTRLFATTGKLLHGRDSRPTALLTELTEHLLFMEHEGLRKNPASTPYWLGTGLSLVDLTFLSLVRAISRVGAFPRLWVAIWTRSTSGVGGNSSRAGSDAIDRQFTRVLSRTLWATGSN
jgi:glutathione S-transferase